MDFLLPSDLQDNHSRTIIHIDLDCFYAQVEMLKNPSLCNVPLGIKQKNIVVTCNYPAREFGITKCMFIDDAKNLCSNLVLVNGEDLHDYRQASYNVTNYLQKLTAQVERLGLDENYVDVTELVNERLKQETNENVDFDGYIYDEPVTDSCKCGCFERLIIGSKLATEIRAGLKQSLGLTSCAGIAHNKLLAKLVGAKHKPNQQTVLVPCNGFALVSCLPSVGSIPGIGQSAAAILAEKLNVTTVQDLQRCSLESLQASFGAEKGRWLLEVSFGIDNNPVKASGKPHSIGLEDSCRSIKAQPEVRHKLMQLLSRLVILIKEDGRIPRTIKLTIRKYNNLTKTANRETRQCNLPSGLFHAARLELLPSADEKIMSLVMRLFLKVVDVTRPYHITLLGLAFTKFHEKATGRNSVASFLMSNVAVQSVLSIKNSSSNKSAGPVDLMECSTFKQLQQQQQDAFSNSTDGSESEVEPSPKKCKKLGPLIARRRCFKNLMDCGSPSKLRVAELRLNSMDADAVATCPPNVDESVFNELPYNMQQELSQEWKRREQQQQQQQPQQQQTTCLAQQAKKQKTNTLYNYFLKNYDQM